MNYISNKELYVEIMISKAKGYLTKRAEEMLKLLADRVILKMRYQNDDDMMDCYQTGLLDLFTNWYLFNEKKSTAGPFPYYTEIFKRALCRSYNQLHNKRNDDIKILSLDSSNDGMGIHTI